MRLDAHKRKAQSAFGLLLMGMFLACLLWVRKEQQQYALNRQLIGVLISGDTKQATVLIEAGADPNTRYKPLPAPSISEIANQLLHRSPLIVNISPTALMMACGAIVKDDNGNFHYILAGDPHLTQTMLVHGAHVNATSVRNWTALHCAVRSHNKIIIKQLLDYGANPNSVDIFGRSIIRLAESNQRPDIVVLLRKYSKHF